MWSHPRNTERRSSRVMPTVQATTRSGIEPASHTLVTAMQPTQCLSSTATVTSATAMSSTFSSLRSLTPPNATTAASCQDGTSPRAPRCWSLCKDLWRTKYCPTAVEIWLLGLTIVIGGQYIGWNAAMGEGFVVNLISFGLLAVAYVNLCLCTAEIAGSVPFAGGAYGLARCTLGFYFGFCIGAAETLEYIAYVAAAVIHLARLVIVVVPKLQGMDPLIIAIVYLLAFLCNLPTGTKVFWVMSDSLGAVSLVILLVYGVGCLQFVDMESFMDRSASTSHSNDGDSHGTLVGFLRAFPVAIWFFVGIEAVNLVNDQVENARAIIPKAQISCILTLCATGLLVLFVAAALPQGTTSLASLEAPFNNGFVLWFKLSSSMATILSLPATFATACGFMWGYGKLIKSMAQSRLLPDVLALTMQTTGSPYMALASGSVVSFMVGLLHCYVDGVADYVFSICAMSAFLSYTGQCIGYVRFKVYYREIPTSLFPNPFGIYGAFVSIVIWIAALVAVCCFRGNREIIVFFWMVILLSIYYFLVVSHEQTFSEEEKKVLLVVHVAKFNQDVVAQQKWRLRQYNSLTPTPTTHNLQATMMMRLGLPTNGTKQLTSHKTLARVPASRNSPIKQVSVRQLDSK